MIRTSKCCGAARHRSKAAHNVRCVTWLGSVSFLMSRVCPPFAINLWLSQFVSRLWVNFHSESSVYCHYFHHHYTITESNHESKTSQGVIPSRRKLTAVPAVPFEGHVQLGDLNHCRAVSDRERRSGEVSDFCSLLWFGNSSSLMLNVKPCEAHRQRALGWDC